MIKSFSRLRTASLALLFVFLAAEGQAFPPAPYYTLYGTVRDQVGQTITADGAVVILLQGTNEVQRTMITQHLTDQNYELVVNMDANRAGTTLYSNRALATQSAFSLVVEMNGVRYYPIEVAGTLTAGKGGERILLDLNLGEDSDRDGLPDIWEQWQLYQAGYYPDSNGSWPINLIDRNGDFDHDGLSNWLEYVAGTFAGDATEKFDIAIKEKSESSVRLEFYAITGKTYTIERSSDLVAWTQFPFATVLAGTPSNTFTSAEVGITSAYAVPVGTKQFYRLTVR
jgi:hypothetical protein